REQGLFICEWVRPRPLAMAGERCSIAACPSGYCAVGISGAFRAERRQRRSKPRGLPRRYRGQRLPCPGKARDNDRHGFEELHELFGERQHSLWFAGSGSLQEMTVLRDPMQSTIACMCRARWKRAFLVAALALLVFDGRSAKAALLDQDD